MHGKQIDTVHFSKGKQFDMLYVRKSLIEHDGYDSAIKIYRGDPTGYRPYNELPQNKQLT